MRSLLTFVVAAAGLGLAGFSMAGGTALAGGETQLGQTQLVQAGTGSPGRVSTVLYKALPQGLPVEVTTFDDSDLNLDIKARLVEALQKRGQMVSGDAPMELSFESEVMQGQLPEASDSSFGRITGGSDAETGNRGSSTGVNVEVNVWSSTQNSVLGGRREGTKGDQAMFHINAVLRDRESGEVLWQGDAFSTLVGQDHDRIARSMVEPLAGGFGRTVTNQPFDIE